MISHQESLRGCLQEEKRKLEERLTEAQKEKDGVASEFNTLSLQLEELKTSLETQTNTHNDQIAKVK